MTSGPQLVRWEEENVSVAHFEVDADGNLVLDHIDGDTGIIALNPTWLRAQGYGHHIEDEGATVRVGRHVFRKLRDLREPFVAYLVDAESGTDAPG